jgi:hypothetical protein
MKVPLDLINGIRVASPCPASWEQMAGDHRVRHCSLCNQSVYELSTMTGAELAHFLGAHDEDVCVRLYRRKDGTVMTRDCPKGTGARMTAVVSWVAISVVSLVGFLLFRGWGNFTGSTANTPAPGRSRTMGKLCVPPVPPPPLKGADPVANDDHN